MKIEEQDGALILHVYVQPRAARSEVVGEHDDRLKIRIAAPPVEGEANAELERFLAKLIGVPRSNVSVVGGAGSRRKTVAIVGVSIAAVRAALRGR